MKKINFFSLGLSFAGCFLGAGYVSGQELWQFFGSFGGKGFIGLLAAIVLLFAVGMIMIALNRKTGIDEADKLVVRKNIPAIRMAVTVLEIVFLFGVCTIMAAGVGALLNQLTGLPVWLGALIFTAAISVISLAGFSGMISAFSATVPILVVVTLIFGVVSVVNNGIHIPEAQAVSTNPLMGSWFVAAITFACYNIFGSIAMIAPLGNFIKDRKNAVAGMLLGAFLLLLIALSVLVSVCSKPDVIKAELPMLKLALDISKPIGFVYGVLLLLAMFGTALSSLVAFVNMVSQKVTAVSQRRKLFTAICGVVIFCCSLFGFGDLISVIYPLFGYCSSVFIVLMAVHYFKVKRNDKVNENQA